MKRRVDTVFWQSLCLNSVIVLVITLVMVGMSASLERSAREDVRQKSNEQLSTRMENLVDQITSVREYLAAVQAASMQGGEINLEAAQRYLQSIEERLPLIRQLIVTYPNDARIVSSKRSDTGIASNLSYYSIGTVAEGFFLQQVEAIEEIYISGTPSGGDAFVYALSLPAGENAPAMNAVVYIDRKGLMDELFPSDMASYARADLFVNGATLRQVAAVQGQWFDSSDTYVFQFDDVGIFSATIAVENDYFDTELFIVSHYLILILIASFIVGVIAAYFASARQNRPVRKAISELTQRGLLAVEDQNVFNGLLHSVDNLMMEKESAEKTLSDYQSLLRENMLDRLFASTVPCPELGANIAMEFEQFPEKSVVYYGKLLISAEEEAPSLEMTVMLLDFLRKQLPKNAVLHSTDALTFGLVYPFAGSEQKTEKELEKILSDVPKFFAAQVVAVSGGYCESIASVGVCYERAQLGYYASFERRGPRQVILEPDDPLAFDEGLQLRPLQTMYQYMANGDSEHAVTALETFFACPTDVQLIDIRERYCALKVQILLASREIAPNCAMPQIPNFRISDSAEAQLDVLSRGVRQVCGYVQQRQSSARDDQFTSLMEYLNTHYSDSSLCAASLADEFRVSEKYLFSLFKKQTGYSPISYLHRIRMQQAAKLLVESDLTAQEISEQVGFANFGTFHKAFKREFGLAPSKYRETAVHD